MNSRPKWVLLVGGMLVALMLLFPPWVYFDPDYSGRSPAGYHFFLTPPAPQRATFGYPVRFPEIVRVMTNDLRLMLQLLITIPTTLGLALLLRRKHSVITISIGIISLLFAMFVVGLIIWMVLSEGLEYGYWSLP